MAYQQDVYDGYALRDDINTVCTECGQPELFCACPDAVKRTLEGWDD